MRELSVAELVSVQGGIVPLLVAGVAVLSLSGCSTVGGVRRPESPQTRRVQRP